MHHMNKIIFDIRLKKYLGDYCPLVKRIVNTQVQNGSKVSSTEIMVMLSIDLDWHILWVKEDPDIRSHHDKIKFSLNWMLEC